MTMMPEGPEVKTIATRLSRDVVGKRLTGLTFHSGRYTTHGPPKNTEEFTETLPATVSEWSHKGKFQYFKLDSSNHRSCWITLGMSGRFYFADPKSVEPLHKHARVIFHLENAQNASPADLIFVDSRNFGTVHFCLEEEVLKKKLNDLGPSILTSDLTPELFLNITNYKRNPDMNICKFLMNQKKISGVGNYLLSEAIYKARIDPFKTLKEITTEQKLLLLEKIKTTAADSFEAQGYTRKNGGSFRSVSGNKGGFDLEVYAKKICPLGYEIIRCEGPHGRALWYVPQVIQQ